jgi:hypothetical protein
MACNGWTLFERGKERPRDGRLLTLEVLGTRACDGDLVSPGATPAKLLGVEVQLTSWSAGNVPANFYYASLDDGAGNTYRALPTGCEPPLSGAPLADGQSTRGFLTFPVPPLTGDSPRGLRLRYDPRLPKTSANDPKARAELPLASGSGQ